MWRAVAGTDLLRFVLKTYPLFTQRLVVQFSEIALSEVFDLIQGYEPVATHIVGFRIPPLLPYFADDGNDRSTKIGNAWFEKVKNSLIDADNTDIDHVKKHHHGFKYFHKVHTYILE